MGDRVVNEPRARDLGIPFEGKPGPTNAITDVQGVEVGHTTLISGHGKLIVGKGPVRTGVTAILPRGKDSYGRVFAAWKDYSGIFCRRPTQTDTDILFGRLGRTKTASGFPLASVGRGKRSVSVCLRESAANSYNH